MTNSASAPQTKARPKKKAGNQAWTPRQHGAWAMVFLPAIVGLALRAKAGASIGWGELTLTITWVVGYLAFNALTLLLRAAPKRRGSYLEPVAVYATITLFAGLATLWFTGPQLAWWLVVFAAPAAIALWLAYRRSDRSLLSGAMTTLVAAVMTLVYRYDSPGLLVTQWDAATTRTAVAVAVGLFGYFFGTVVHVKALIREHGQSRAIRRSIVWHCAFVLFTVAATALGVLAWPWIVFALAALARAVAMPRMDAKKRLTVMQIGLAEVALSVVGLICIVV